LAYNRDLQEDKEPLFDSVDQVLRALLALQGMISTATFHSATMSSRADAEALVATDVAEWLVHKGMPFRQAHGVVGAIVRESIASGRAMVDLVREHSLLGPEAAQLFDSGIAVQRRSTPGGAGPLVSGEQRERLQLRLQQLKDRV
jgi:argininosuccinate lyase